MTVETLLNDMVEKLGLTEVASRTGYSKSAICHVQKGTYRGKTEKVLDRVRNVFSTEPVACPVLGEIPLSRCVEERNRPFAATNPLRVRLARACRNCDRLGLPGKPGSEPHLQRFALTGMAPQSEIEEL